MTQSAVWQHLVKSALVGTQRQAPSLPPADDALGKTLAQLAGGSVERTLLAAAGILSVHQRVGREPLQHQGTPPAPSPDDEFPQCSPRAAQQLRTMLDDKHPELLGEWLDKLVVARKSLPHAWLPDVLIRGQQQPALRDAVRAAAGARGQWLASLHPSWAYVHESLDPAVFETGNREVRLQVFRALRKTEPARALEMVKASWSSETPEDRAAFIEALGPTATMDDEPFLEQALDDKRKDVRRNAASILMGLKDSRLVQRMTERLLPLMAYAPPANAKKSGLTITLPAECDAKMIRDGIEQKTRAGTGEKAWWFIQMLGIVPPSVVSGRLKASPKDLLASARKDEWRKALMEGWSVAAHRHADEAWATALVDVADEVPAHLYGPLFDVLPLARRESLFIEALRSDSKKVDWSRPALRMLVHHPVPWSLELSRAVVEMMRAGTKMEDNRVWHLYREAMNAMGRFMHTGALKDLLAMRPADAELVPAWEHAFGYLVEKLQFRQEMAEELKAS